MRDGRQHHGGGRRRCTRSVAGRPNIAVFQSLGISSLTSVPLLSSLRWMGNLLSAWRSGEEPRCESRPNGPYDWFTTRFASTDDRYRCGSAPMTSSPAMKDDPPSFERPPVAEVVLSIQFASIPNFGSVHIGLLWQEFHNVYPKVSEQPPLAAVFETLGAVALTKPQFRLEMVQAPMSRFWFEPEDGGHLLQVQQDRVIHNWRKRDDEPYPRYEPIRERFEDEINTILAFLSRERLGSIEPNQCEVTYTNLIVLPDGTNPHDHLERITPLWGGWRVESELAPLENAGLNMRYLLRSEDIPVGRVYVDFQPVFFSQDANPAIKLEITARGKPQDSSVEGAFRLLDAERRAVVRTFAHVTSEEMRIEWGQS